MKSFFAQIKVFALGILCLSSALHASCPLVCTGPTGATRFCNLTVTGAIAASRLCVSGNEQIGGNLTVCGTTTSFVSGIAGGGLTGPISFATLAAFGFAWDPQIGGVNGQDVTAGNNTVDLDNSSSLFNTTFAPSALTPQISGTYLIHYILNQTNDDIPAGTFSIFVNGVNVPGSEFAIDSGQTGAVVGQALAPVVAGQPVIINFDADADGTITGTASLTVDRVGN
jgi:hypothetical protein